MTLSKANASGSDSGPGAMPLSAVTEGQEVRLITIEGGRNFQLRMAEMGLMPGATFRVLRRGRPGPFVISFKGCRMVLGHGMIPRVHVRLVS